VSELPKEKHPARMLSLDKTKEVDALVSWLGDHKGLLSWKMDGLTVVLTYEDGKLVINLNNPSDKLIRGLNEDLESIVKYNRKADYAAQSVDNGFMVYVICPDIDSAAGIIYNIVAENKIKVNALTEKSFSKIKSKNFSEEPEQKEFNSKAQKLLRRASDYKKAMTGSGRLGSGEASQINKGMNSFGNPGNSFIKQGREMNKSLMSRKKDINTKINQKAGITSAV
jgi:hypothetical protein